MNRFSVLAVSAAMLVVGTANLARADEAIGGDGRALAKALIGYMITTYSCHGIMGSLDHYRAAKAIAVEIYARMVGDRNKAVLAINELDQSIKAAEVDKMAEKKFKEKNLSEVQGLAVCQNMISDSLDDLELARAKLNLL